MNSQVFIWELWMDKLKEVVGFDFLAEEGLVGVAEEELNKWMHVNGFAVETAEKTDNVGGLGH